MRHPGRAIDPRRKASLAGSNRRNRNRSIDLDHEIRAVVDQLRIKAHDGPARRNLLIGQERFLQFFDRGRHDRSKGIQIPGPGEAMGGFGFCHVGACHVGTAVRSLVEKPCMIGFAYVVHVPAHYARRLVRVPRSQPFGQGGKQRSPRLQDQRHLARAFDPALPAIAADDRRMDVRAAASRSPMARSAIASAVS